jgi:hypothetical protein
MSELEEIIEGLIAEKGLKTKKVELQEKAVTQIDDVFIENNYTENIENLLIDGNNAVKVIKINDYRIKKELNINKEPSSFFTTDQLIARKRFINQIRNAKKAYVSWFSNIKLFYHLQNIAFADINIPLNETDSEFAQWYYGDGQILSGLKNYNELEQIHNLLYDSYFQLYKSIKESKIKGKTEVEKEKIKNKIKTSLQYLKKYSNLLSNELKILENIINEMSVGELAKLN